MTRAAHNRRLRRAFNSLNKLYFNGDLRPPAILEYARLMPKALGEQKFLNDGSSQILIDECLIPMERSTTLTLLHEMIHQKNGPDYKPEHGMLFDAETHRLYMMGAYNGLL